MSKSRRAFLHEVSTAAAVTAGSASSIIPQTTLDRISKNTGILRVGLLEAGDLGGAHTLIGGNDGGIQMYSEPNKLVFSVSPQNGGRLRLGALDQPGITMVGGSVHIEGDCVIDGTLTTSKLQVGDLARILLENDTIQVGSTDEEGRFTGVRISQDIMGGYNQNAPTWFIDTQDGSISSGEYIGGVFNGIKFGENEILISSIIGSSFETPIQRIRFESYVYNDLTPDPVPVSSPSVFSDASGLVVDTSALVIPSDEPALYERWGAKLKPDGLEIWPDMTRRASLYVLSDRVELTGGWADAPLMVKHSLRHGFGGIVLDQALVWVLDGLQLPTAQPSISYAGCIYYDTEANRIKVKGGDGQWHNIALES